MNWFYRQSDRDLGPVSSATLQELAACGVITHETLVREADSADWMAYRIAASGEPATGEQVNPPDSSIRFYCMGCGQKISAGREDAGKAAECPSCGTSMTIPGGSPEATAVTKPPSPPVANPGEKSATPNSLLTSSAPPPVPQPLQDRSSSPSASAQPETASVPRGIPQPPTSGKAKNRHLKPVLIGCGALLLVGCILVIGTLSAIVGAVNQAGSESSGGEEAPVPTQSETTVQQLPPFDYNTWNKRAQCHRCQGTGQLVGQCTRCRGNGTIMTGNPNSLDPMRSPLPSMQVPCPQCRGGGQMPVRCSHCQGTGTN